MLMIKGDVLFDLSRYEAAAESYQQAARSAAPQAGRAWLMAGYAAWQAEDLELCRRAFQHAADFRPEKGGLGSHEPLAKVSTQ
jgi:tetratricopeptide (TPR) repeat protein